MLVRGVHIIRINAVRGVDVGTHDAFVRGMELRIAIYVWLHCLDEEGSPIQCTMEQGGKASESCARKSIWRSYTPRSAVKKCPKSGCLIESTQIERQGCLSVVTNQFGRQAIYNQAHIAKSAAVHGWQVRWLDCVGSPTS
jgi:hypothetical protein